MYFNINKKSVLISKKSDINYYQLLLSKRSINPVLKIYIIYDLHHKNRMSTVILQICPNLFNDIDRERKKQNHMSYIRRKNHTLDRIDKSALSLVFLLKI